MRFSTFSSHTLLFRTVLVTVAVLILLTNVAAMFPGQNSFFGLFFGKLMSLLFGHHVVIRTMPTYTTAPVDTTNSWDPSGSPTPPKP